MRAVESFMTTLDKRIQAFVSLQSQQVNAGYWVMKVKLYREGQLAGTTNFTLQGYSQEEAEQVARTLPQNAFLRREIDEFLWR